MSRARRLTNGTADGRKHRSFGPRMNTDGPWPRLRQLLRDAGKGKDVDSTELSALIERAGRTDPGRVGRAESRDYAAATALRDRLTEGAP